MHYKWQGLVAREKRTATAATTKNQPFKKRSGTLCNEDAISISHFTVMFARYINNNTQTQRRMQLGRGKEGVKQNITKAVHVQPQGKKILAAIKKRERERERMRKNSTSAEGRQSSDPEWIFFLWSCKVKCGRSYPFFASVRCSFNEWSMQKESSFEKQPLAHNFRLHTQTFSETRTHNAKHFIFQTTMECICG